MEIGEKIKSLRLSRKLSLKHISEKTGFTKSVISQIERGISNPSINSLRKIAQCLNAPVAYFFDEESAMFNYTSDIDPPLIARKKELSDK